METKQQEVATFYTVTDDDVARSQGPAQPPAMFYTVQDPKNLSPASENSIENSSTREAPVNFYTVQDHDLASNSAPVEEIRLRKATDTAVMYGVMPESDSSGVTSSQTSAVETPQTKDLPVFYLSTQTITGEASLYATSIEEIAPETIPKKEETPSMYSVEQETVNMYATSVEQIAPETQINSLESSLYASSSEQINPSKEGLSYNLQPVAYSVANIESSPNDRYTNLYLVKEEFEIFENAKPQIKSLQDSLYIANDEAAAQPEEDLLWKSKTHETKGIRNWNDEVMIFTDEMSKISNCDGILKLDWGYASSVQHQFVDTATLYAKIIISELGLSYDEKTIKPIEIGGVAGGQKYLYHNILFKFAMDTIVLEKPQTLWMYGGTSGPKDKYAMKSARNEMKGQQAFSAARIPGLHTPSMVTIDYKGYRLIAMAVLPISKDSLIYGSSDSGQTIHADVPELNDLMKMAADRMNLKGHVTGQGKKKKLIYGPGDIEGHKGKDGKFYVLDFGRMLPPEDPRIRSDPTKRAIFYHLLRSELVQANPVPLCSDAYSSWNNDDDEKIRAKHNQEVTEATQRLYNVVIPEYARELDTAAQTFSFDKLFNAHSKGQVRTQLNILIGKNQIHHKGINLRHLGSVRLHVTNEQVRRIILTLCIARVIKDQLRDMMRDTMMKAKVPSDNPFKADVIDLFNTVLGHQKNSAVWWREDIRSGITEKYVHCLTDQEKSLDFDLRTSVDLRILFVYLLRLTGVKLKTKAMDHLLQNTANYRFVTSDLKSLDAKVSTGYDGPFSDAMKLYAEALPDGVAKASDETVRLLEVCSSRFRKAHEESSTCAVIVHRWAKAQTALGYIQPQSRTKYWDKAHHLYEKSIKLWPGYISGLTDYARFLREVSQAIEATETEKIEEYQKKALALDIQVDKLSENIMECYIREEVRTTKVY